MVGLVFVCQNFLKYVVLACRQWSSWPMDISITRPSGGPSQATWLDVFSKEKFQNRFRLLEAIDISGTMQSTVKTKHSLAFKKIKFTLERMASTKNVSMGTPYICIPQSSSRLKFYTAYCTQAYSYSFINSFLVY